MLTSRQEFLIRQFKHEIKKKNYKVTNDDGQYLAFDNGKRFYKINFDKSNKNYFGIREDGSTRNVFDGVIRDFDDFRKIDELTNPDTF